MSCQVYISLTFKKDREIQGGLNSSLSEGVKFLSFSGTERHSDPGALDSDVNPWSMSLKIARPGQLHDVCDRLSDGERN